MSTLRIYCFGGLRVEYNGQPLPPFPTQKVRSLLAYLLIHRHSPHSRTRLAGLFWGDMPEEQARRNLNTTLWRLRRLLEPAPIPPGTYLLAEGDTLAFNCASNYWLDVDDFRARIETAKSQPPLSMAEIQHLQAAVDLYRAPFLEDLYDDWVLLEQEWLRGLYLEALQRLLACYRARGEYPAALVCGQRLIAADPLREETHRELMALYRLLGQRAAALRQYETCRQVLATELGIEPMAETVALYEQIKRQEETWTRPVSSPPPAPPPLHRTPFDAFGQVTLIGREQERAWLTARLQAAGQGEGGMVLVEGEAGIGKTRLLQETTRLATRMGLAVLWGTCPDLQAPPPYQGLVEALRAAIPELRRSEALPVPLIWLSELTLLLPELPQLFAGLPPHPSATSAYLVSRQTAEQGRLLEAMTQYLLGLARLGPCLLILEDLQWADLDTLETLRYLLPRLKGSPVLVIATIRPEEIAKRHDLAQALATLEATGLMARLPLNRLSAAETDALVHQALGVPAGERRPTPAPQPPLAGLTQFIYRETEGNPFFVGEILKTLVEEGYLHLHPDQGWETTQDNIPPVLPKGIRQAVQRRLARLTPTALAVLETAAVLGHDFTFDLLQQVSGQNEEATLEATDDLLRCQLLAEGLCPPMAVDQLCFSHDKIRQVVYEGLSRSRRRYLHRQAGEALARLAAGRVAELAHHFYLGGDDRRALYYCLQAGDRARSLYANQSALSYYNWAIEAAGRVEGKEGERGLLIAYEQRGRVWEHLGQSSAALADFAVMQAKAEGLADGAALARAVRRVAWVWGQQLGDWERGLHGACRAQELAEAAGSQREAAIALLDIGYFHNMRGEYAQSLAALRTALTLADRIGDVGARAASLQYLAVTYQFLGQYRESLAAYQEAYQLWENLGIRRAAGKTQTDLGYLYLSLGELDQAGAAFRQARATLVEIEAHPILPWVLIGIGALQHYQGEHRACLETLAGAAELERQGKSNPYVRGLIRLHRGIAHWHLGNRETALADLEEALSLARQSQTPTLVAGVLNEQGRCLRQAGEAGRAIACHQEALSLSRQTASRSIEAVAQSELGLDRLVVGQIDAGLADLEAAVLPAGEMPPGVHGQVLINLAEGQLLAGQAQQALAPAQESLALTTRQGLHELAGWGYQVLARILTALNRPVEAEEASRRGRELHRG